MAPADSQLTRCQNSRLLQCFRAIGLIVDDLPIVWYGMGKESFAVASLGKSFVVYKCDKLTPVFVSPQLPKKIAALEVLAKKQLTFTACGRQIIVWKRVDQVTTLVGHKSDIKQLLMVGTTLFSMDQSAIRIWDLETFELINQIKFSSDFVPSVMMHPSTYLNKILVGSETGALELWNVRTMKCIYRFQGWGSAVTYLEQSPAVDVVGVGLGNGKLIMHHLQLDKLVMEFKQEQSKVTTISFRTDSGAQAPLVVSGTSTGDIAVWNLQSKKLESMIAGAHDGAVTSLVFLPNEPILLSSGTDNSLKMWIFDHLNGGTARLLKSREGHRAPPTRIRYYGNNTLSTADGSDGTCCQILSAGQDRAFRVFHTAREQQSVELSQGPLLKKAKKMNVRVEDLKIPPITQFAAMETRERDWSNVVTCHENEMAAYVWRFERRAIGKQILRQFDPSNRVTPGSEEDLRRQKTQATCVAISTCGNFALVGSIGGAIFKYNMQSGEKRGSFPTAATPKPKLIRGLTLPGTTPMIEEDMTAHHAHDGPVSAVVVDALNQSIVSGGIDGKLKFWDFRNHGLVYELNIDSPISQMELHRDSNLLSVACDDQVIRVYDISTRKLVRRFHGHSHRITDMHFSGDARWLYSSSADASLRVWDLPTGKCVDWIKFHKPVTGLAVSPTGEFIATTHVGYVGIYLWANRGFFMDVFLDTEPQAPTLMDMPVPLNEVDNADALGFGSEKNPQLSVDGGNHDEQVQPSTKDEPSTDETGPVEPLGHSLITLSAAPRALWQSLFNLELIKKRNKPIEPPKAPEQAPFFLPTMRKDDVKPTFVPVEKKPESAAPKKDDKEGEGEGEDDVQMEGWGVGSDDEAWGDDDDEKDAEKDEEAEKEASAAPVTGSRIIKSTGMVTSRCKLATLLAEAAARNPVESQKTGPMQFTRFHSVALYMQTLSAAAVDVEMSTLCMGDFDAEGKEILALFLTFLREEMATQRNFQVLQAYLNRFLKLHEQLLVADAALLEQVDALCNVQQQQWEHLQQLLHNNLCLVQYFSKIQM
uniref:Small-subunit processome Utp21 domain-containing protein n=1 Tax=Globisporangium ultimum (strain ATCC 200006 / CBS 805.95 / DAOM BR144) TaxID=431595 RepID=K3W5I7_GLOUD